MKKPQFLPGKKLGYILYHPALIVKENGPLPHGSEPFGHASLFDFSFRGVLEEPFESIFGKPNP
mgnify:CR=1 FL=1